MLHSPARLLSELTPDERRKYTEAARRRSRFVKARRQIQRIADGAPLLTPEEFAELRSLLPAPAGGDHAAA